MPRALSALLKSPRRRALATALCCGFAQPASAENHALVMTIDYAGTKDELPPAGIELDSRNGIRIAQSMGVAEKNITVRKNGTLTRNGIAQEFAALTERIRGGDKVFIYYSGHGSQRPDASGSSKCREGMVSADPEFYSDQQLENNLAALSAKASQTVMFNDSCFSGGTASKAVGDRSDHVVKAFTGAFKSGSANDPGYRCGDAVNKVSRSFEAGTRKSTGGPMLYVAASADNEVSIATRRGSVATLAWIDCLGSKSADTNQSGMLDGNELKACAQSHIRKNFSNVNQTVTLVGDASVALSFAGGNTGTPSAAPVNAVNTLNDLYAGRDKSYRVDLQVAKPSLRIQDDFLDFSVTSNKGGYLYILQVGSDGSAYNLLFPNGIDPNNRVDAGTHALPRQSWRLRTAGPEGTSYLMAYLSPVPKNFAGAMKSKDTFAHAPATQGGTRNLIPEATGAGSGQSGTYGTSEVVPVRETR